jgi:hypothetical protein
MALHRLYDLRQSQEASIKTSKLITGQLKAIKHFPLPGLLCRGKGHASAMLRTQTQYPG